MAGSFGPDKLATEFEVDLTALVAVWTANSALNFGMAFAIPDGGGDGVCFLSSEASPPERRPLLTVTLAP